MSKHQSRRNRWVKTSDLRYSGANGYVELNREGMWDAVVTYQTRRPLQETPINRPWRTVKHYLNEYKRAREAMMAVEDKIKVLKKENNLDVIL